jgi:hypothetical protein
MVILDVVSATAKRPSDKSGGTGGNSDALDARPGFAVF